MNNHRGYPLLCLAEGHAHPERLGWVFMAFSQWFGGGPFTWGVAPGYGETWPLAIRRAGGSDDSSAMDFLSDFPVTFYEVDNRLRKNHRG